MPLKSSITLLLFALVLIIIVIPLFGHLEATPIYIWDEARLATNALEMSHSGNWIVTTFDGSPDMWNTKPPLMIWLQVLMIKILGPGEIAVRLPAALAAVGTCLLIFFLFARKYKKPLLGFICVAVLITTLGYVMPHGTRTGDYDSLLTMFITGYSIFYFLYLDEGKRKYLYATFIFLTLAALTKGVQALVALPALFVFTIYKKQVVTTLKNKDFYIGLAGFVFFVAGYYLLREHYNPGYIKAVQENEIGGRYNTALDNHSGDVWYYYDLLSKDFFHTGYLLVIPGILLGCFSKHKNIRELTIYATLFSLLYLLVISNAQTKLPWYGLPLYPFMSIIVGIFIYSIFEIINNINGVNNILSKNVLPYAFLFIVFVNSYSETISKSLSDRDDFSISDEQRTVIRFMQEVIHGKKNIDGYSFYDADPNPNFNWYYRVANIKSHHLALVNDSNNINAFSKVIVYKNDAKHYLENHYNAELLESRNEISIYKLNGKRAINIDKQPLKFN